MPLSAPAPRQLLHNRLVQCWGYRREDGLWDIEGRMVDTKTYPFPNEDRGGAIQAGEPLHDMWIRLTVDPQFRIHDVEARTDGSPFGLCPAITSRYRQLIGVRIGPGWSLKLKELFAGVDGCTNCWVRWRPPCFRRCMANATTRTTPNRRRSVRRRPC